jgi:predicted GIY-YIG superfamily endonuclease
MHTIVYWIKYEEYIDPYQDGYVGITKDLPKRMSSHSSKHSKNKHVFNRLMKGAVVEILHECDSREEAIQLEKQYRPTANIGWNLAPGGDVPPPRTKATGKSLLKGEDRTDKQKAASQKLKETLTGRVGTNLGKTFSEEWKNKLRGPKPYNRVPKKIIECPHCGKQGGEPQMKRWHYDNCKFRTGA